MAEPTATRTKEEDLAAARVGSTVRGKWRLDTLLGVGGVAAVYAATHRNGQRAALKIMHAELARDRSVVERFLREAYVANKVGHPACVRVLDDDTTETDEPFLIMELLEGETVRDYWRRTGRTIAATQALHIAERVLDCLSACHGMGVVHRDLKPANIFLTRSGELKLLDFGVARENDGRHHHDNTAGLALGTPAYMSPEQAKGDLDHIDGRSDIFSVGALLHALITGRRIHRGKTERESLHLAATQPVPSVATVAPEMPAEIVRVIDKALAWEPERRFASAREMQAAVISAMRVADASAPIVPDEDVAESEEADLTPVHEVVTRDDPRVRDVQACLLAWEHGWMAGLAQGFDAPAAQPALRRAFDATVEVHRRRNAAIHLTVRPYGLCAFDHVLWEPALPLAAIPHRLFEGGVRSLRIVPGVSFQELCTLLSCLASRGETDVVSPLWEESLPHVRFDACVVAALGDVAAREEHVAQAMADESATARRVHAARSVGSAWSDEASPLAPDDVIRAVYASQLTTDRWVERYAELCTDGLIQAARARNVGAVLGALRKVAAGLYADRRYEQAAELRAALTERLAQRVGPKDAPKLAAAMTSAMLGKDALDGLLRGVSNHPEDLARAQSLFVDVPAAEAPTIIAASRRPMTPEVHRAIAELLARVGGEEQASAISPSVPSPEGVSPNAILVVDAAREREGRIVVALAELIRAVVAGVEVDGELVGELASDVHEEIEATGRPLEIFYAPNATFVGGRMLFGDRSAHDAAAYVAAELARVGAHAVRCAASVDPETLVEFARALVAVLDKAVALPEVGPLSLCVVSEGARTRGIVLERFSIEPRVMRVRASAVAAVRAHLASKSVETADTLRHAARAIVDVSGAPTWLLAATTEPEIGADEASRAVGAAMLAAAMGRLLVDERSQLFRMVLAALTAPSPSPGGAEDTLAQLAATLASQTRGSATAIARVVIAFEAAWIARSDRDGPPYRGAKTPTLHARIVAAARAYIERLADRKPPPPTPQSVVAALAARTQDTAERTVLRLLVATLGFVPAGTVVRLSSGETAEVIASNRATGRGPLARLVLDEGGEEYSEPFEVELALAGDDGLRIAKVVSVDQWRKGEQISMPKQERRAPPQAAPAPPGPQLASSAPASSAPASTTPEPPGDGVSGARAVAVVSAPPAPPPSAKPTPSAAGDLGTTPLPHMLVYMLDHGLTGTLVLQERDGTSHDLYFSRGGVVRARTGRMIAPLGSLLVSAGLLTDADATDAIRGARAAGLRLGEHLIQRELLARVDLLRALEMQVTRKLEGLVNLEPSTTFAFFRDTDLFENWPVDPLEVDPLGAVLAAARVWSDRSRVRKALERASNLVLSVHPESTIDLADLTAPERMALVELHTQPSTVGELIGRSSVAPEVVETLVFVGLVTRQFLIPGQTKGPMGVRPAIMRSARPSPFPERISSLVPNPPRSASPRSVVSPSPAPVSAPRMPTPPPSNPDFAPRSPPPSIRESPVPRAPESSPGSARTGPKKISWSDLLATHRPSKPALRASAAPSAVRPSPPPRSVVPSSPKPKPEHSAQEPTTEVISLLRRAEQALTHKDITGSLRIAKRAKERDPHTGTVAAFVSWVQVLAGEIKPAAAILELDAVLAREPGCTQARVYKAKLLKRENKVHEAMAEFEAVLAAEPDNKDAQNELKLILLTMRPGR